MTKYLRKRLLESTHSQSKIGVLDCLAKASKFIGKERMISELCPAIREQTEDNDLAVRVSLAECVPYLVEVLGKDSFTDEMLSVVLKLLRDDCPEVRTAVLDHFEPISKAVNPVTLLEPLYPVLSEMQRSLIWRVGFYLIPSESTESPRIFGFFVPEIWVGYLHTELYWTCYLQPEGSL